MRPLAVVMGHVGAQHVFEVAAAEDQQPVETLAADGADEALGEGVRLRRTNRCPDHPDAFALEDLIEGEAELAVTVVDQEPRPFEDTAEVEVACLLGAQPPLGLVVQPARWTRRLPSSMKKST